MKDIAAVLIITAVWLNFISELYDIRAMDQKTAEKRAKWYWRTAVALFAAGFVVWGLCA